MLFVSDRHKVYTHHKPFQSWPPKVADKLIFIGITTWFVASTESYCIHFSWFPSFFCVPLVNIQSPKNNFFFFYLKRNIIKWEKHQSWFSKMHFFFFLIRKHALFRFLYIGHVAINTYTNSLVPPLPIN